MGNRKTLRGKKKIDALGLAQLRIFHIFEAEAIVGEKIFVFGTVFDCQCEQFLLNLSSFKFENAINFSPIFRIRTRIMTSV